MNKAELIEALSSHYDGSKTEAAKALNAVVETITYKTAAGRRFDHRFRRVREGRATGADGAQPADR